MTDYYGVSTTREIKYRLNCFAFFYISLTCFIQQPVRFQLNHASAKQSGGMYSEREYSIWVSDLPIEISEEDFRKTFSTRYDSVVTAKRKSKYIN